MERKFWTFRKNFWDLLKQTSRATPEFFIIFCLRHWACIYALRFPYVPYCVWYCYWARKNKNTVALFLAYICLCTGHGNHLLFAWTCGSGGRRADCAIPGSVTRFRPVNSAWIAHYIGNQPATVGT